jgi:hypothetical protein
VASLGGATTFSVMARPLILSLLGLLAGACSRPAPAATTTPRRSQSGLEVKCKEVKTPRLETVKRLATTREPVRILVYGQSISSQSWWREVRAWLKARHPDGNLIMEEHARGACPSQCLIGREAWITDKQTYNRVPDDVFRFRPDLIIFNVYGRHDDYERLVRSFKEGCSAFDDLPPSARCRPDARYPDYRAPEVLLQTYHHLTDDHYTDALPVFPPIPPGDWEYWMSRVWIPRVALQHDARIATIWEPWWDHMQSTGLKARDLLIDGQHLNEAGNHLMAALTERALCD